MARRFVSRRGRKRSTSWIASLTSYDSVAATSNRLISLAAVPGAAANVWGAVIGLVVPSDLPLHGGEDAVLTRIRGRLGFVEARVNSGAGLAAFGYQIRVVVVQTDWVPPAVVSPFQYTSSAGLGNDNILHMQDVVASPTAIGAVGAGYENMVGNFEQWLELDIKAKRRLQEDRMIAIWFQTILPGTATGGDFRLLGGLRTLLMRPR